jgi:DNA-directed RNA polymerase specialized sigma24 family protein
VRAKEKQVTSMPESPKEPRDDREELQVLLDQELSALPDKYRLPVVLCDLEGRTRKEVAAQLKIPEGTLSSRLATAHQMLAKRLARHGLAVSGGSVAALLAQDAAAAYVPASLVSSERS